MKMSQQALWSGRFDGEMDDSTLDFTSSLDVDVMLSFYDVMGSLAHVRMLKKCNIIPAEDADKIIEGLKTIVAEMESGEFELDESLEDIHTNVEFSLAPVLFDYLFQVGIFIDTKHRAQEFSLAFP